MVQVQPPQPQNRLISQEIRRFFFTFRPKRFPEKLYDFAKFAVDPNRDPDGSKNRPGGGVSTSGLSVFSLASEGICQNFSHGFRRLLLGRCRDVGVGVQCEACREVPQHPGYRLDIHSVLKGQGGEGVPLRYNYDKPEKPRRIKGFEVFSLIFSSFSKPKNHTEISRIAGGVSLTTNE